MKGSEVKKTYNDGDFISKGGKIHIVFNHKICRPSIIDDTEARGNKEWDLLSNACKDPRFYKVTLEKSGEGSKFCKACNNQLKKNGIFQS